MSSSDKVAPQLTGNDNNQLDLSTRGMIYTLIINIVVFVCILIFFEVNRFYRQIFLKRYQKRFIEKGRVPPKPPNFVFGWLLAIMRVSEQDVLQMVGLDAYMLLRFQVVCLKFCVFASVTG
jgi:Late exocytosis, associated with Golgi transport